MSGSVGVFGTLWPERFLFPTCPRCNRLVGFSQAEANRVAADMPDVRRSAHFPGQALVAYGVDRHLRWLWLLLWLTIVFPLRILLRLLLELFR
jgi:hypothetical protein